MSCTSSLPYPFALLLYQRKKFLILSSFYLNLFSIEAASSQGQQLITFSISLFCFLPPYTNSNAIHAAKQNAFGCWRDSSAVKRNDHSSRGLRFNNWSSHGISQLSMTPVPEDQTPSHRHSSRLKRKKERQRARARARARARERENKTREHAVARDILI